MNENAIIIFQENPTPGKVKTKLGEVIGGVKAAEVYKYLLRNIHDLVRNYPADVFVYFSEEVDHDFMLNDHYHLALQGAGTNTEKMKNAYEEVFSKGFEKVLFLRPDTKELTLDILDEAFEVLNYQDLVIGPAQDGNAYLLGMKMFHADLLDHIDWEDGTTCENIVLDAKVKKVNCHNLPMLFDVESYEDLKSLRGILNIK
ncbi:hypothetical protein GCM10007049_12500 [Echinicola pacifica]|uniref:Glycosyltransferase n=1 Tax=Echinicola pacifica TaxID=346377 RepID=A0A918UMU4_9BACT|nr:TIGR04282 family arsenosugar biosynthesis glycosyltransferase [Echinicola pacifica]GGZ21339.1 hypothetical protein GCM10007049_12500 [Echinicola pacifica]